MSRPGNILVADDDAAIRMVLNQALARAGHLPRITGNAATLWRWVSQGEGDVVITDVVMPDENAFNLIPRIKQAAAGPADHRHERAEHAADGGDGGRAGRLRVSAKTVRPQRVDRVVARALAQPKAVRPEPEAAAATVAGPRLVGRSAAMQEIYRVLARMTQTDLTVMITGESGTGKELVARALHDYSRRKRGPFVAVNMAAIPRELIESELFGHEKGAFTGALTRAAGPLRAGAGWHAVPRRDRRHADGSPDAAAAGAAGGRIHHGRRSHGDLPPTSASSPPPIAICASRSTRVCFARTSITGSTSCRCGCRRCASATRTFPTWSAISCRGRMARGCRSAASTSRRSIGCGRTSWPGNIRELENVIRRLAALHAQDTITAELVDGELAVAERDGVAAPGSNGDDPSIETAIAARMASLHRCSAGGRWQPLRRHPRPKSNRR